MSFGIHTSPSILRPSEYPKPSVCRSIEITTDIHLLDTHNVHLCTAGIHSPVSRHHSSRTCVIIQGLTDSFPLGPHVAFPGTPSTGSCVEYRSTPALMGSKPHASYTTPYGPGSKVQPCGVGAAKAKPAGGWSIRWGSRPGPFAIFRRSGFSSIPSFSAPRHILCSCA